MSGWIRATLPAAVLAVAPALNAMTHSVPQTDPYLWLEDVAGDRALAWVADRNAETRKLLEAEAGFADTRDRIRAILDSREKIPTVSRRGDWLYNLWQDEKHPRGLWRRATLAEYRKPAPAWQTVLDLDALGRAEKENWVWGGAAAWGRATAAAWSNCRVAAPTPWWCANSTPTAGPSSRADTRCRKPRPRWPGWARTRSSSAPTSGPGP